VHRILSPTVPGHNGAEALNSAGMHHCRLSAIRGPYCCTLDAVHLTVGHPPADGYNRPGNQNAKPFHGKRTTMLFSERLLFIHVPKTAGMSVEKFLIDNVADAMTVTDGQGLPNPAIRLPAFVKFKLGLKRFLAGATAWNRASVKTVEGSRHVRLKDAQKVLAPFGRKLADFDSIIAVVRNPYDLEVSRYHFLRLGFHGVRGLAQNVEQEIALSGDFERFAAEAPYHGRLPAGIEDWYEIDGKMPENMRIVRFEALEEELNKVVGELYPISARLRRLNATAHAPYPSFLSQKSEAGIYRKYRWLFDRQFYRRELG